MRPRPSISFTIKIPVPRAVANGIADIKYAIRKAVFKMRPYRCARCDAKMYVRNPQYELVFDNGKRLLVENVAWRQDAICRDCLVSELETKDWMPHLAKIDADGKPDRYAYRFWSTKKCDVTGAAVRSYKNAAIDPYVDMVFCMHSWNSSYVSKYAVIECVKRGKIRTSIWGIWKRYKMAPMNDKGFFINDKGELI